jgi:predicted nucleic acid-binding protein
VARLAERLTGHHTIGLDSAVFIYHVEAHPRYVRFTRELLDGVSRQRWRGVTSTLSLMELTVRPWRLQQRDVATAYEALLMHFPNLTVADVSREVARRAA